MGVFDLSQIREFAMPVAQHEMGHFVAATVLGFSTGDVEIVMYGFSSHRGGAAINLGHGFNSLQELEKYIIARIQVLYAGCVAQSLSLQPVIEINEEKAVSLLHGDAGKDDYSKGRELFQVLRGIRYPDDNLTDQPKVQAQLDQLDNELWVLTTTLVSTHAKAIVGLARNLAGRVTDFNVPAKLTASDLDALSEVQKLKTNATAFSMSAESGYSSEVSASIYELASDLREVGMIDTPDGALIHGK